MPGVGRRGPGIRGFPERGRALLKVAVVGGGAVGLGLSSCLLAAGAEVHLQVRTLEAADALRRHGLQRTGRFGEHRAAPGSFAVGNAPDDVAAARPDALLVCTKATARDAVADALAAVWPRLAHPAPVVLCANGWGNAERFARALPAEWVFTATVTTGFRRQGFHRVEITVHGDEMHVGSVFGADTRAVAPLCAAITAGGLPCQPTPAMEREVWAKLLYNCALNPLAALLDVPYGELASDPHRRAVVETVVVEIFRVLSALGRSTKWPSADAYLDFFFRELLPPTRDHESSMLQDLRAGRPTEIDALCGAVARLGAGAGVPTPVNDALATLIRARHPTGA